MSKSDFSISVNWVNDSTKNWTECVKFFQRRSCVCPTVGNRPKWKLVFRRFLSQFSTDFHEILQGLLSGPRQIAWNVHAKIIYSSKVRPFDIEYHKFLITTSLYKPIKLFKLRSVLSHELHYMPDGLTFKLYNIYQWKFYSVWRGTR